MSKRIELSLEQKIRVLKALETKNQNQVAAEFGISQSAVSRIKSREYDIFVSWQEMPNRKRARRNTKSMNLPVQTSDGFVEDALSHMPCNVDLWLEDWRHKLLIDNKQQQKMYYTSPIAKDYHEKQDYYNSEVPQQVPQSGGNQQQKSAAPQMPILKKAPMQQQTVMPSSQQQQQAKLQSMKQVRGVSPPHQPPPPPPPPAVVAPPEVCLRWNSYHSNMQATFPNLLTNEQFVDVTLACEGRSIKCHKVILSACSAYFEELLSANPCQHPIVLMKDLRYWEVQALVDFMYRGEVNVGQDKLPSLLAAAEALQIKGLAGPASTSSSHDEDSLPPPMTPSSLEDFLDESVPSPSSARRARKRRMMSAMQSQTQQSPQSSSMAPLRMRQQPRSSAPVPSTSGYRHESPPDEPPPLRRARRSEAPMEIKIEPIDIDESNDSIADTDEVYDGKKFNTVTQHDGHDNGQNLSPEQKPHLDVSNQNDFSGPSSSNNMLSHSDLHSYPFEPGSIKDTTSKRISDTGYVDDPMNPAASSSDHNVLAETGGSEESILGHV